MAQRKSLNVNGKAIWIVIDDPDMPLLYALRDNLALHGPRFGCGLAHVAPARSTSTARRCARASPHCRQSPPDRGS